MEEDFSPIDKYSQEAALYTAEQDGTVRCLACAHRCRLKPEGRGICMLRHNVNGKLFAPWGYVSALACDPVEKKPFYHFLPGTTSISFGMLGCNFKCPFCQNYSISQFLREEGVGARIMQTSPKEILDAAIECGSHIVAATYNEPLITSEWAAAIFDKAGEKGLYRAFVSNGFATEESIRFLAPRLEAFKVDLKCFSDSKYSEITGGRLAPVLDSISRLKEAGVWVEIVTLVVPGFNDSYKELSDMAEFIRSVSADIPWHVTSFHPDFKYDDVPPTAPETILRAASVGKEAGLNYVYAGNIAERNFSNTICPNCTTPLVERAGFKVTVNRLAGSPDGKCPACGASIPGVWNKKSHLK